MKITRDAVSAKVLRQILILASPVLWPLWLFVATAQSSTATEQKGFSEFSHQVKQYLSMERALPADKLKPTKDIAELEQERTLLRKALKEARSKAGQGDVFTPLAAGAFRKALTETMSGPQGAKIHASLAHAEPGAPTAISINGVYPAKGGQPVQSVPPTLLLNLPVLPKGLEYCIVGKTLALRDTDASMVVDYLPHALP